MKREELHSILFNIMCEIDNACKKENISYFLGGGTMLGAVRHKDFIPWDDDADICLWYRDYPLFKKALEKHLPSYMKVIDSETISPNFYDFVCRVIDKRYYWHEPQKMDLEYDNLENYICVDVFLVVNSANTWRRAKRLILWQKITYGLAMGHRKFQRNDKYTISQKLQGTILSVTGRLFSINTIVKWRNKIFMKYNDKPGKYCLIINDIPKYWDLPYEREWFEGTVNMPFRGKLFPVQKGFDKKMKLQYGDYMKPPVDRTEFIQHMKCD
ncbi:LicD family protein [Murimonas intestini]|uniref:Lipopolysaccharide cholinephosphotransferase n=1 Tax=Murimonas intestini TaxID=1337051 RepID=A0AB73SYW4_9FIRM|nr:LicD family protein [Murimonas intestini]MCR1842965.1 LicD family protein [Murimonas intestini]MCR1864786.1 LicD family protein [Murimonas intestini]MCR1885434.1 LicD family protein [Murimonas intestini]